MHQYCQEMKNFLMNNTERKIEKPKLKTIFMAKDKHLSETDATLQ